MINPQPKEKPWRSAAYRKFVRQHSCCVCGNPETVCHHLQEKCNGKMGGKLSDLLGVPLCIMHHTGSEGVHTIGRVEFYNRFEINFYKVIARLLKEWVEKCS